MWLFTVDGFYSIVQKPGETGLQIRARSRDDLVRLRGNYLPELTEPIETRDGDYRYRAFATHEQLADALSAIALDIHYSNFKSEVGEQLGWEREALYHEVWQCMLPLQRDGNSV